MPDLEDAPNTAEQAPAVSLPPAASEIPADDFDKERAMATIKNLREFEKAAKAQLKELDALKSEKAQRDEAELSAAQKAEKKANELATQLASAQAQLRRATLKDAAGEAAQKASLTFAQGALSDAIALGLFDSLEWDDDRPKGMTAAVKDLAASRPHWFVSTVAGSDIGATAKGKQTKETDLGGLGSRWGIKVG